MEKIENVPAEILEFLNRHGVSLLIKGSPGSGKTTLVLTLMKYLGKCVYLTTRTSTEELKAQYSWLDDGFLKEVIDASDEYILKKDFPIGSFDYKFFPNSFKKAYDLLATGKANTLIIDSWNAIVETLKFMEDEEQTDFSSPTHKEMALFNLLKKGINIVIVMENKDTTKMDYLVDGVINLVKEERKERIIRMMVMEKLRGVEMKKSRYLFSLKGGIFEYLPPFEAKKTSRKKDFELKKTKGKIVSTGNTSLDEIVGNGFSKRDTIFINVDENVPMRIHIITIMLLVANTLKEKRGVLIIPPDDLDINEIKYQLYLYGLENEFEDLLRVFVEPTKQMDDYIIPTHLWDIEDTFRSLMKTMTTLKEETGNQPLTIIGIDRLRAYLSEKDETKLMNTIRRQIREDGGITVITGRHTSKEVIKYCIGISNKYLKLEEIGGQIVLLGIKPWTNIYNIEMDVKNGYPDLNFKEIV